MSKKIEECALFDDEGNCIEWKKEADGTRVYRVKDEYKKCYPEKAAELEKAIADGKVYGRVG